MSLPAIGQRVNAQETTTRSFGQAKSCVVIFLFGGPGQPFDIANDGDGRDSDPTDPGDAVAANECPGPSHPAQPNSWHGTHVAGTVGVVDTDNGTGVAGVAWEVGLVAVRVLGKCGGTTTDITDGIRWAAGGLDAV